MNVLTMILAGGQGSRLSILGEKRAKPAVPFAGKYRIIDFALSNVVNDILAQLPVHFFLKKELCYESSSTGG